MLENSGLHQLTGKMDTIEVANLAIKGCATVLYILAVIELLDYATKEIFSTSVVFLLILLFGWMLNKFKSRSIAFILIFFALFNLIAVYKYGGGLDLAVAILFAWVGIKGIQSTFKYHSFIRGAGAN